MRPVLSEFTSSNENGSALGVDGRALALPAAPLHECAVTEADGPSAGEFCNLIARPPERAVAEANAARVRGRDFNHRRVGSVKRDELAVCDEQSIGGAVLDNEGGITIIGADAEKIAIANARPGPDEFIADFISETEGVVHVLPVGAAEDECLAVFPLPSE